MIKFYWIIILFLTQIAHGAMNAELQFEQKKIKQGSIQLGILKMDAESAQKIPWQDLKGKKLGEVIYLYDVSPLIRRQGGEFFETEVKVVFAKVPETHTVTVKEVPGNLIINLKNVEIIPTDSKEYVYGKFSLPKKLNYLFWILILAGLALIGLGINWIYRRHQKKVIKRNHRSKLKSELIGADSYPEVVSVWMKRGEYLEMFPQMTEDFRELERSLFKFLFKPNLSESELVQVVESYRNFRDKIRGGLDGI